MARVRIQYNSPVVLSFVLLAGLILLLMSVTGGALVPFFSVGRPFDPNLVSSWVGLVGHALGHGSAGHLVNNLMLLLLLGPILEEKYGSKRLLLMMIATSLITGVLQILFFSSTLLGASGIVFMFILLASITNVREGDIPATLILVIVLYLGQEVVNMFGSDNISQFAHITGGACGAAFGLLFRKN